MASHDASISAWCEVLDCPSMVAALVAARYLVAISSAARRKMAARSEKGISAQPRLAAMAAVTACCTCSGEASCSVASTCAWWCGMRTEKVLPVRTSLPPMSSGMSTCSLATFSSAVRSSARSGLPGA